MKLFIGCTFLVLVITLLTVLANPLSQLAPHAVLPNQGEHLALIFSLVMIDVCWYRLFFSAQRIIGHDRRIDAFTIAIFGLSLAWSFWLIFEPLYLMLAALPI